MKLWVVEGLERGPSDKAGHPMLAVLVSTTSVQPFQCVAPPPPPSHGAVSARQLVPPWAALF